jgi:hypothetical protein
LTVDHHPAAKAFWPKALITLGSGYRLFLPAIILTWVMVAVVASQVPRAPWIAQAGLFLLCLDFYLAAAARACGVGDGNPVSLALSKTGMCREPMILAFFLGGFTFLCFVAYIYLNHAALRAAAVAIALSGNLFVFARSWPMWGVPFFFEGGIRWSPGAHAAVWQGPGLRLALRITGEHGVFNIHTLRFMACLVCTVVLGAAVKRLWPQSVLFDLLMYPFCVPLLSIVVISGTQALLADKIPDKR